MLKVFDAVHGLEAALLARGSLAGDLPGYLAVLAQLEAALRLLADNCGLAAQRLADIVAYLGERDLADPRFVADLASLDAGLLAAALGTLEAEFGRHLAEHSAPLAMKDPDSSSQLQPGVRRASSDPCLCCAQAGPNPRPPRSERAA